MRRAILWAVRCRFGRRCMDVEFLDVGLAPGCSLHVDYACPACGTKYATAALAGRDGMFVSGGRVRA